MSLPPNFKTIQNYTTYKFKHTISSNILLARSMHSKFFSDTNEDGNSFSILSRSSNVLKLTSL